MGKKYIEIPTLRIISVVVGILDLKVIKHSIVIIPMLSDSKIFLLVILFVINEFKKLSITI